MKHTNSNKAAKITTVAFVLALMVMGGCAGQGDQGNNASAKIFSGLSGVCSSDTYAATDTGNGRSRISFATDTGNGRMKSIAMEGKTCASYTVDISGSAQGSDSVIIGFNGQEISVSVESDGSFHAQIATDVAPESVTITPMNGDTLGEAFVISPASV